MTTQELGISVPSIAEREATVHLNDTLSSPPTPPGAPPVYDFDADLTAQVRNTGRFEGDAKFPIGTWPATGEYAAVLLTELREEQHRIYQIFEDQDKEDYPDARVLRESFDRVVVGVINLAVRQPGLDGDNRNGDDFFIAELKDNVQIVSQLRFLRGVASRGLVRALWRVRDDNLVWPAGEQYRSSIASQLRNFPECLTTEHLDILPRDNRTALILGYGDKYGNGRFEKPQGAEMPDIVPGQEYSLRVDGKEVSEPVVGAARLTDIPQDRLGMYVNPADSRHAQGVRYLEFARLVANPNDPRKSAYEKLRSTVLPDSDQHPDWPEVEIQLAA